MLSTALVAFATSYDLTIKDNFAYGIIDGYMVTVYNNGSKKTAYVSCCFPTNEECQENKQLISTFEFQSRIGKLIDSNYPALKDYEISDDSILFTTSADLKAFDSALVELLSLLSNCYVPGVETCVECGKRNNTYKQLISDNKVHCICEECADEYSKKIQEEETNKKDAHYARGTAYALFGGIIGTLITLVAMILIGPADGFLGYSGLMICIPCAALTTTLCFLFYRLFTGVKGLERIIPCLITSAVFTLLSVYFSTAIMYAKTFGVLALNNAKLVWRIIISSPFKDPFYKRDFFSHTFYSFVAVIIVVLIYSIVFEEKKKSTTEIIDPNLGSTQNDIQNISFKE